MPDRRDHSAQTVKLMTAVCVLIGFLIVNMVLLGFQAWVQFTLIAHTDKAIDAAYKNGYEHAMMDYWSGVNGRIRTGQ